MSFWDSFRFVVGLFVLSLCMLPISLVNLVNIGYCKVQSSAFENTQLRRDVNVTNNHPLLTGKIVIAHMKETLDYYKRLDIAELEGDLLKAFRRKDFKKANSVYKRLVSARISLSQSEAAEL